MALHLLGSCAPNEMVATHSIPSLFNTALRRSIGVADLNLITTNDPFLTVAVAVGIPSCNHRVVL